jgi:hypothetical protein
MNKFFIFAIGAAAGSVVTWKLLKTKYEKIAQDEIESMKDYISRKEQKLSSTKEITSEVKDEKEAEPTEIEEAEEIITELGYKNYADASNARQKESVNAPYVITPEEFTDDPNYAVVSLTYYADGVLADDWDAVVEDVENLVGKDSLTHFGEYEDDAVHVRNERLKCDYEILMETREYYATVTTNLNPSGKE